MRFRFKKIRVQKKQGNPFLFINNLYICPDLQNKCRMADAIRHTGTVESIEGFRLAVRIAQQSACAACAAKGYCSTSEVREKIIYVDDAESGQYKLGDRVMVEISFSMGMKAVVLAFVFPFFLLVVSLFAFTACLEREVHAALFSLLVLAFYYFALWMNRSRIKRRISFVIRPVKE